MAAASTAVGAMTAVSNASVVYTRANTVVSSAGASSVGIDVDHDGTNDFTMTADTTNGIQISKDLNTSDPNGLPYDNGVVADSGGTATPPDPADAKALTLNAGDTVHPGDASNADTFATYAKLISANGAQGNFTVAAGKKYMGMTITTIDPDVGGLDYAHAKYGFIEFQTLSTGATVSGKILGYGYDTNVGMPTKVGAPGDANGDSIISVVDYTALDAGFLLTLPATWANGDFDGNGVINYLDYAIIDSAFQSQGGQLASSMIAEHAQEFGVPYLLALNSLETPAAVPEPTSIGLLALGAAGLAMYRGRRRVG